MLIDAGGKNKIRDYSRLLTSYGIDFVAMTDSDYQGYTSSDFIILSKDLEQELIGLGWNRNWKKTINPQEAYDFVSKSMKNRDIRTKIHESSFGEVVDKVLTKVPMKINIWHVN